MVTYLYQSTVLWMSVCMLTLGAVLSAIGDLFRVRKLAFGNRSTVFCKIIEFIEDLLLCLFGAICVSVVFYITSDGHIRILGVFMLFVGFGLYRISLGRLTLAIVERVLARVRPIIIKLRDRHQAKLASRYTRRLCNKLVKSAKLGFGISFR